ncbi:protein TASOR 2 [Sphaerodactylus townsendi]|uniref:protein TASOR 2 n=1 Tax=Sphaerodactylus townsendi TaxID=933632 RepID=UPI002026EBA6|nr:protein TASOR 2 [Sphaerodactylus townsendi]XP_048356589.1 protein TASOR 2 [Sphaerodactylus townsendi]
MSPLTRKSLAESKVAALYRAWKGQLFIQDQRLCDLAFLLPFSGTIPAQLPTKLEASYAVAVPVLRKRLPAVFVGRDSSANYEVDSEGMLICLYEVEISNQDEPKANQLIESLKEKDVALVRCLNERGLFILLNSSSLAKEKDSGPEEIPRLQALFVISSPSPMHLAAKDGRCNQRPNERSSQVSLLLPALRYALAEAAKDPKEGAVPLGALVKQHVQEFAKLDKSLLPTFADPDRLSVSFDQFSEKSDLEAVSGKCSQKSFALLQLYLSDPQNYALEISAASPSTGTDSQPPNSSKVCDPSGASGLNSDSQPPERSVPLVKTMRSGRSVEATAPGTEGAGKPSRMGDRTPHRCKRKSSRLLSASTRKKWAPLKVLCIMESNKKRKKSKKKKLDPSSATSKTLEPSVDSGEPTLKLKNLQYPLRRKRGAQVLSAEFVQRTRHEPATKAASSSESLSAELKKPRLLNCRKSTEVRKAEINEKRTISKKYVHRNAEENESEIRDDENATSSERSAPRDEYDSHALNMLADLALSSCNSALLSNTHRSRLSLSPSRDRRHLHGAKLLRKASDHEYHRINAKLKGSSLSGRDLQWSPSTPVQPNQSAESPSSPQERSRAGSGKKKIARSSLAKPHAALPVGMEEFSGLCEAFLISIEHSYASPALEPLRKQLPWRGTPNPPNSKNGVKSAKSGPLVGKVLPFRHQQNICHPHKQLRTYLPFVRSTIMAARPKEDFNRSRQVTFSDQSVQVTCQWEAEYLFSLDSKYTNNSLEKTVVRAVHGPWDVSLSDDVEEMKLILHMWVALFYSKPFRSSTVRKVVEHSNPAKYISLNSAVDPLELIDDGEVFCDSEKHSVDLFSEAYQTHSKVEGRACSPVEKPLSCNKLSSTNSIECAAETYDWPLRDGPVSSLASDLVGLPQAFDKVPGEEADEEFFLGPVISTGSPSSSSLRGSACSEAEANKAVHLFEVSQSDSSSVLPKVPETSTDAQTVQSPRSSISSERPPISSSSSPAEKKDNCQIGSTDSPRTSGVTWLETNTEYGKGERLCKGERDPQDLPVDEVEEDGDVESVEVESIGLALSDSNDADAEPRDMDLEQDNEELPHEGCVAEETCVCDAASPGDSLTTLIPTPTASSPQQTAPQTVTESPGDQDGPAELAPKSSSVNPTDSVEDFCILQDSKGDVVADSCLPQAVSFHQVALDEITELARCEDSVVPSKHPISPNPTDLVEHSSISQEDKATELNPIKNDSVTQGDSVGSKEDLVVFGKSRTLSNPFDRGGVSQGGKEIGQPNAALHQTYPACQSTLDDISELPGNQQDSAVSTTVPVPRHQINAIDTESQEEFPLAQSSWELAQVQSSMLTEDEHIGNQNDSLVSADNLASPKRLSLVGNTCVSPEEKGSYPLDSAPLQNHPAHQTAPDKASKSPEGQEDSTATVPNPAFPEQIGLDEGPYADQEEEDVNEAHTVPLDEKGQVIQVEQDTRQMLEFPNDAIEDQAVRCLRLYASELKCNSQGPEPCGKSENGSTLVTEEAAHEDKLQVVATVSGEIKSFSESIDPVTILKAENEGSNSKEDSGLNWISCMTLESVTPPESDEEICTADQLNSSGSGWVLSGHSERQDAKSEENAPPLSTSHEGLSSRQVDGIEKDPSEENEAASISGDVFSHPCCEDQISSGPLIDSKSLLAETAVPSKNDNSIVPMLGGEVGLGLASHEASILEREGSLFREECVEILPCVPGGHLVEYSPDESDSPFHGGTSEGQKQGDPENPGGVQLATERTEFHTRVLGPSTNWEVASVSADNNQGLFGDPRCRNSPVNACRTRSTNSAGVTGSTYICDLGSEEEISKSDDWTYMGEKTRKLDAEAERFDWPFTCRRDDRPAGASLKSDAEPGPLKGYINFSVTKKHKDKTRTFYSSERGDSFTAELGSVNSLSRIWRVLDDPVQSTLDMECLRFHYKLKQILKKKRPQCSTSVDLSIAPQVIANTLPLKKVPETPVLNPPPRSRSPLLITIANPGTRRSATHRFPRTSVPSDPLDPPPLTRDSFSKAVRSKSRGPGRPTPFHLNKLTYNNKLKDCRGDISVIMDEFAELSKVLKLDDRQASNNGRDPNTTSEDVPAEKSPSLRRRTTSYDHLFDDLCNTLHFRLTKVAKEACKKPYSFYLVETDDDPSFGRIKNLLKKGGHSEADPQHFCKASRPETDRLVVIIRNEDIFAHVHKIPSLLRLKRFPNVTFAGMDSPEDILDHTYQELFHSGGFVVSDDQVLETVTTGELKDVIKTLEQLNEHRKWRWLLHHKETKKLREKARVDSAAHSKHSILRSCQGANFTEVLHYHCCDSRSSTRAEYLSCLLNLQVQHIGARLAIFLTGKPSASKDALESKGILVLDVNTFVATAQDLAKSCRSNY